MIEKGKKPTQKLVFSRYFVTLLLFLFQLAILLYIYMWLGGYSRYAMGSFTVFAGVVIFLIFNGKANPDYKISWILPVAFFPLLGTFLYAYVHVDRGAIYARKRLRDILDETERYTRVDDQLHGELWESNPLAGRIADYIALSGGYTLCRNTGARYFPGGEAAFEEMKVQLEDAEDYIFIEFFIIEEGVFWNTILDILEKKARQGVEVRVLYDAVGCGPLLSRDYPQELKQKGIQCRAFARIRPFLSTHYNNRDHRKIMVIDGRVAFSGGINLADEYINEIQRFGHWKDNAFLVTGDAARIYTLMFLQMWNAAVLKKQEQAQEDYGRYLDEGKVRQLPVKNQDQLYLGGYIVPYGDGPHQQEAVAENVYLDMLYQAREYVYIMTPYLILDYATKQAMIHAAHSGVDVRLVLPHIPDKWYAFVIARTWYPELLEAGVSIYEYTPGFVHSKMFVADGQLAVAGTINLDFRSLYLHYECAALFVDCAVVDDMEKDFQKTFKQSQLINIKDYKEFSLLSRLSGRVLRLFGPLM